MPWAVMVEAVEEAVWKGMGSLQVMVLKGDLRRCVVHLPLPRQDQLSVKQVLNYAGCFVLPQLAYQKLRCFFQFCLFCLGLLQLCQCLCSLILQSCLKDMQGGWDCIPLPRGSMGEWEQRAPGRLGREAVRLVGSQKCSEAGQNFCLAPAAWGQPVQAQSACGPVDSSGTPPR